MNIGLVQGNNYSALIRKTVGEEKIENIEELSEIEKLEISKKRSGMKLIPCRGDAIYPFILRMMLLNG